MSFSPSLSASSWNRSQLVFSRGVGAYALKDPCGKTYDVHVLTGQAKTRF